jgi:hypothetical protein
MRQTLTLKSAYGIAYSRAPVNMRGLVSAINLLNTGFAYVINLALSSVITDPHLIWDFGGPAIVGAIVTVFFYWNFRHIDKEEYVLSTNQTTENHESADFETVDGMDPAEPLGVTSITSGAEKHHV